MRMEKISIIKFKKEQDCEDLDDTLIPYWHIIQEVGSGEYTACGQAITEYHYDIKTGEVTCPHCLAVINFYKRLGTPEEVKPDSSNRLKQTK